MLNIEQGDPKLIKFVEHVLGQYLQLMQERGILNEQEAKFALDEVFKTHIHTIDFKDLAGGWAVVNKQQGVMYLDSTFKEVLYNAEGFDDPKLDQPVKHSRNPDWGEKVIRKNIFHELTHFLQQPGYTFVKNEYQQECEVLNEDATVITEEFIWAMHLNRTGDKTARVALVKFQIPEGEFTVPTTVSDKTVKYITSGYFRELDTCVKLLEQIDMSPDDFIRGSTIFGQSQRTKFMKNFESTVKQDFADFASGLDNQLHVRHDQMGTADIF